MTAQKPRLLTFGCRLNIYESEVMSAHAAAAGLDDAIIVNTCAVTKEAERQARQAIRRARRENPNAKIIVTGCAAQVNATKFAAMEEIDHVIGNDLKLQAGTWTGLAATSEKTLQVNDIMAVTETASHLLPGFEGHVRAFLQVQNGCDHRCTFCIIPYGRGNSRSVPVGIIVDQLRELVAKGYREAVLTGVDVTSYGKDLPGQPTLGQMIRRVLALVPELPRLRLSSLDPVEIDDDLWHLIAEEPRLMPHLHLSLQAGADLILKRMKRRHLQKDLYMVAEKARKLRPDMVFGADIIAGFPTETEDHFRESLKVVNECDITYLHVFPYSERDGTPAARMPQMPKDVRKERAQRLRELGDKQLHSYYRSQIGQTRQILVESDSVGRTEHFAEVQMPENATPGQLLDCRLTGMDPLKLRLVAAAG